MYLQYEETVCVVSMMIIIRNLHICGVHHLSFYKHEHGYNSPLLFTSGLFFCRLYIKCYQNTVNSICQMMLPLTYSAPLSCNSS